MIAEQLRKSILQAAIQGKLTEHLPEDGDARDLLAEIQAAKIKRIKNGSLKQDNGFHENTEDDNTLDIPGNWCWVDLGDVFEIARGGSPRPIQSFLTTNEDGINWIKIGDTDIGGKYINQTKEKIIPEGVKKSRVVNPCDLLLTNSMSFGRPYILNIKGCIHDGWLVLSPLSDGINREYFYYLLSTEFVKMAFAGTVAGAVVKNLNSDKVRAVTVPLPPALEQERIVSRIEELLPYIEELEKDETKLDTLQKSFPKKMKDSLLQSAIRGKLTEQLESDGDAHDLVNEIQKEKAHLVKEKKIKCEKPLPEITDDEKPFDIPESWEWVRLRELGQIFGGGTPKTSVKEYWSNGTIPWITPADMSSLKGKYVSHGKRFITEEGLKSSSTQLLSEGSVIYSSRAPIGYIAIAQNKLCTNQGFKSVELYNKSLNLFLYYCLIQRTTEIQSRASGTTFKEISGSEFSLTVVPLPPLAEQQRIVASVEELMKLCDILSDEKALVDYIPKVKENKVIPFPAPDYSEIDEKDYPQVVGFRSNDEKVDDEELKELLDVANKYTKQ
jgi:type I restriction enzyme S subunit